MNYTDFIERKSAEDLGLGFAPTFHHPSAFDFQQALIEFAVRKGRAAIFADCGLGKTLIELVWAKNVTEHTGGRVLILAPLAVSIQHEREAAKFGFDLVHSRDGKLKSDLTVTNYERLHHFNAADFRGIVCDESSILWKGLGTAEIMRDLPGAIILAHEARGFDYSARFCVWKEPLGVRNRTMARKLAHRTTIDDSTLAMNASADYLLLFRRHGRNAVPVTHPNGFLDYAGSTEIPQEFRPFRGWVGDQKQNLFSHWIWRRYASSIWDDVREDRVLPFRLARDEDDERHIHPLQLDLIERAIVMWTNPGETVLTPFLGVGSEAFVAVELGRRAIGAELKATYYRQAARNLEACELRTPEQMPLFGSQVQEAEA